MTNRWPARQTHDRRNGPAVGAAGDGLEPGTPYDAVIQSTPSGGLVKVTIPSLHLSLMYTAKIQPGVSAAKGEACLVIFDIAKVPWVVVGTWEAPQTAEPDPLVSSLPASPKDGQTVDYLADATNGVVWRLRYRAASGSTHKWEFVGGPPLTGEVEASESTASTTYAALTTAGPSITLPLAGDYDVTLRALAGNAIEASILMSYSIGATPAADADAASFFNKGGEAGNYTSQRTKRKTGLPAEALVAKYRTTAGTGVFGGRFMAVTPVRVG